MPISERQKALIDANVPPHLREYMYRMVSKEGASGGTSSTGAKGLLQFTKGTGKAYGLVGPQGDLRGDDTANLQAGVKLTEDNAKILQRYIGRAPTHSELALAHQQGADTAGRMLTGQGNAPAKNLAVNKVDPNLPPQAAAEKIMNYYGFDKRPGMTLNASPMFDPNAPGAFAPPVEGAVPFAGGFNPPGVSLATPPAAAAPATFQQRLMGADGQGGKGTPYAGIVEGAGDIAKGFRQKSDPELNAIAPSSVGMGVAQQQATMQPLAANMLTQMIQQMQARRGMR